MLENKVQCTLSLSLSLCVCVRARMRVDIHTLQHARGVVGHNHNPLRSLFSSSSSSSSSHHPRIRIQISLPPSRSEVVAVVVTCKADVDVFYGRLLEAIRARAWEATASAAPASGAPVAEGAAPAEEDLAIRMPVVGVAGILRKEQETWESAGQNLQDAFQDLNALMSKAKEMMELAEKMRQKLLTNSSAQSNSNDEEMGSKQDLQDLLLSVGIVSPVTKETAGALYHQQLSRQLADFVRVPVERAGGMMALVDVYCLFNRARGTELISPEDLLQACSLWEKFDVPVMLRKFDSGVKVIQTKTHSDDEVSSAGMSVQMGSVSTSICLTRLISRIFICQKLMDYTTPGSLWQRQHIDTVLVEVEFS
ncbi:hypothetical protein TRIUR3_25664 [Triticum urartu]|uniref:Vacuolar protein-sorting-associated protein 36 n=1 Tax=Triticum urartu TaxID=4572 RepID=M7YUI1_TRIUA|nr:hypothetical protein TRIUR3_25664 [Triticum urartu]